MWLNSIYSLNGLNFLVIGHFSGSLQNAYLSKELKVLLCYQNSMFFQLQGALTPDPLTRDSAPGPRWELSPQTPVIGSRSALSMAFPHCSEQIAAIVMMCKTKALRQQILQCVHTVKHTRWHIYVLSTVRQL